MYICFFFYSITFRGYFFPLLLFSCSLSRYHFIFHKTDFFFRFGCWLVVGVKFFFFLPNFLLNSLVWCLHQRISGRELPRPLPILSFYFSFHSPFKVCVFFFVCSRVILAVTRVNTISYFFFFLESVCMSVWQFLVFFWWWSFDSMFFFRLLPVVLALLLLF